MKRIHLNTVFRELQEFYNHTAVLGRELVDECPTMASYEPDVMRALAGSAACNFHQYEDRKKALRQCRTDADDESSFRLQLISLSSNPV